MSILDTKIKEFVNHDDESTIEIPFDNDEVKKYIIDMIREFDSSEGKCSIGDDSIIDGFYVDDTGDAFISVHIKGIQYSFKTGFAGDYWNPPEVDVHEYPYNEWFEFYAEKNDKEMTVREVIDNICEQTWKYDDVTVKELCRLTRDIDGNDPYDDY